MKPEIAEVIADHEGAGRRFTAAGVESFVIESATAIRWF